jgi:hypothetical protein
MMNYNPTIYEINTRPWLRGFDKENKRATLLDVPEHYWDNLSKNKFDYIWLMGLWKTSESVIDKYCFEPGLIKDYSRALKDWKREDVIGSPFAIDRYEVNPRVGTRKSLLELKSFLNKKGIKLILDFIPNHFNAESSLIKENPYVFLYVGKELQEKDSHTFYQPSLDEKTYFAHGRDPFFPCWQDTVQVNFFSPDARKFLTDTLIGLIEMCDGVRCDMAMLALNNVFKGTWGNVLKTNGYEVPPTEFWKDVIEKVKAVRSEFIFIAETYWDLEWKLQQLGFDYTYDKRLTDRLKSAHVTDVYEHLLAEPDYQAKSVRFIENHDEERAVVGFGKEKSKAAAVIISTIQGMRFYNDGQFDGKKIKLPVQLGREPDEIPIRGLADFYSKLISITSEEIFKEGKWTLANPVSSGGDNMTYQNMLAWLWTYENSKRLVVINYSDSISSCRVKFDVSGYPDQFEIKDLLTGQTYTRSVVEIVNAGLFVELKSYQSHIFSF